MLSYVQITSGYPFTACPWNLLNPVLPAWYKRGVCVCVGGCAWLLQPTQQFESVLQQLLTTDARMLILALVYDASHFASLCST
jgi:hypothetical protein